MFNKVAIGVDIQNSAIVAVKAAFKSGKYGFEDITADELRDSGNKVRVSCGLTPRECIAKWLDVPFASKRKALKVLPGILDVELPFPLEECLYRFVSIKRQDNGNVKALALAARMEDVRGKLDNLKSAGIDPHILDNEGIALWEQALRERPADNADPRKPRAVVYIGADRYTIALGRGSDFIASHAVKMTDPGYMFRIVKSTLAEDNQKMEWIWAGPGATDIAKVRSLAESMQSASASFPVIVSEPGRFLARALAVRAIGDTETSCNIRIGDITHPEILRRESKMSLLSAVSLLTSALLLCVVNLSVRSYLAHKEKMADQQFYAAAGKIAGDRLGAAKGEHAVRIVKEKAASDMALTGAFLAPFEESLISVVSGIAEKTAGKGYEFNYLVLGRDSITLRGSADNWELCDHLLGVVRQYGFDAKLERTEAPVQERVLFTIKTSDKK